MRSFLVRLVYLLRRALVPEASPCHRQRSELSTDYCIVDAPRPRYKPPSPTPRHRHDRTAHASRASQPTAIAQIKCLRSTSFRTAHHVCFLPACVVAFDLLPAEGRPRRLLPPRFLDAGVPRGLHASGTSVEIQWKACSGAVTRCTSICPRYVAAVCGALAGGSCINSEMSTA